MSNKRKKLLLVILDLQVGGAEMMLINIVNRLDQDIFNPIIVSLGTNNPIAKLIQPERAIFFKFPRSWKYDLIPALKIKKLIKGMDIDFILPFGLYEFFFVRLALIGLYQKPPIYISIHSTFIMDRRRAFQNWLYARMLTGKEHFLSVCDAQAKYWSEKYWIPIDRFSTIYNGVDISFFKTENKKNDRAIVRSHYNIPSNAFVFITVASLSPDKRHEILFHAFRNIYNKDENQVCYLMIVGGSTLEREKQLYNMTIELGIDKYVVFCGIQEDVRPFYSAADSFVLTSLRDSFSVAALEAMAMGLPIILTDVGGACEMVKNRMNGYVVPPENVSEITNGLSLMIEEYNNFDKNAIIQYVDENYNINDCVKNYEKILMSV